VQELPQETAKEKGEEIMKFLFVLGVSLLAVVANMAVQTALLFWSYGVVAPAFHLPKLNWLQSFAAILLLSSIGNLLRGNEGIKVDTKADSK
jgi:hypothetical protein